VADRSDPCNCEQALELEAKLEETRELLRQANKMISDQKRAIEWAADNVDRLEKTHLIACRLMLEVAPYLVEHLSRLDGVGKKQYAQKLLDELQEFARA
jgi:hypothetical protein